MADKSTIEWTDSTWNIITGCTLVDEGCRNCYAAHLSANWPALARHPSRAGLARNNADGVAKFTGEVRFNEGWLDQPLRWKKPRRIFVCAHGDLFHENVPDAWIDRVFAVMALAPQHTFQLLTKRPERARAYLSDPARRLAAASYATAMHATGKWSFQNNISLLWPLPNVWLGTSIHDQASADLRIPQLLATPAAVRFISAEPLLGPVTLNYLQPSEPPVEIDALNGTHGIIRPHRGVSARLDLVITGGESGKHARPAHPDWFRSLRDQCAEAGVAFHFKQWGQWLPFGQSGFTAWAAANIRTNGAYGQKWLGFAFFNDGACGPNTKTIGPVETCNLGNALQAVRIGKARAGRLLDGVEHNGFPGGQP